jgi:hypothetical protein
MFISMLLIVYLLCLLGMSSNIINYKVMKSDSYMDEVPQSAVIASYVFIGLGTLGAYFSPVFFCYFGQDMFSCIHFFIISICLALTGYFTLYIKYGNPRDGGPADSTKFKNMNQGIVITTGIFIGISCLDLLYTFFVGRHRQVIQRPSGYHAKFVSGTVPVRPQQTREVVEDGDSVPPPAETPSVAPPAGGASVEAPPTPTEAPPSYGSLNP